MAQVELPARICIRRGISENLSADGRRIILKRFFPSQIAIAERIVRQVAAQSDEQSARTLTDAVHLFEDRHHDLHGRFMDRWVEVNHTLREDKHTQPETIKQIDTFSNDKKALVGSMFLHEYAIEASALFNPSLVPHPANPNPRDNEAMRIVLSFRSCGEQHISSITFREGVITRDGRILLEPNCQRKLTTGHVRRCHYKDWSEAHSPHISNKTFRNPVTGHEYALDDGSYSIRFDANSPLSSRVVFPQTPQQSNGVEDVRFVRFVDDDGTATYYGTLTAYDGRHITPQMLETPDFRSFTLHILEGDIVNKGMALFPRKVNGKYWMLSRQDDFSVMIMSSDNVLKWESPVSIISPEEPWEWFKMGNCGSPMETAYGWLVLTHGVGPVRRYSIGVVFLDLDDPTKVIGRLKDALFEPTETEREGYVPNVVYTCGALVRGDTCFVPYAISDSSSTFASFSVREVARSLGLKPRK